MNASQPGSYSRLASLASKQICSLLNELVASIRNDPVKLEQIYSQLQELNKSIDFSSLSAEAQAHSKIILKFSSHAGDLITQLRLLQCLALDGMYGQYGTVDRAHHETFRWAYEDAEDLSERDKEDENSTNLNAVSESVPHSIYTAKLEVKRLLVSWLREGKGILHVLGKLGSGKSTLMKYLGEETPTRQLLQQWAGQLPYLLFTRNNNFF